MIQAAMLFGLQLFANIMLCIHIWKKLAKEYYKEKSSDFLEKLKFLGIDTISIWESVDTEFILKAKDSGFTIISLLPSVLRKEKPISPFRSASGIDLKQNNFEAAEIWTDKAIEEASKDTLVDKWIVSDMPWYLMIHHETCMIDSFLQPSPFCDRHSEALLKENNLSIKKYFDFRNDKDKESWSIVQPFIMRKYINRFDRLLQSMSGKCLLPITFRRNETFDLANKSLKPFVEEMVEKYKVGLISMNAMYDTDNWFIDMKKKYGVTILGGTEGAVGIFNKNGRKLITRGYDGLVSDEHHFMNNRHPTWKQLKEEYDIIKGMVTK